MVKDLENEIAETTASLKNCGDQSFASPKAAAARAMECGQYARKLKLTKENLLHVKEQCDKGLAPDYLPKVIENPGAVPCDNCAANKLLPKDPAAKVLTGLPGTGNVMDLKGGDPNLRTVFGKSAAAPAPAATGVPPPEFIGAWCCNNQFVEAADITAFYAKCCGICGEYCGTTPPIEPSCSASQDMVNGNCVPKCTGGQTRNAAGTCECPAGQVFSAGKCGCPSGQTLTAEGKCVASGGGDGGAVQPPATGQPPAKKPGFWAKVGNFFKNIGNWVKSLFNPNQEGRPLTGSEIAAAKNVFGDKIDYSKVKLVTTGSGKNRTSGYTIYIPGYNGGDWDRGVLLHEMTHIYQRENYSTTKYWGGKIVDTFLGIVYIFRPENVYKYELDPNKSFKDYRLEQQAAIVRDYSYDYKSWSGDSVTSDEKAIMRKMLCGEGLLNSQVCSV